MAVVWKMEIVLVAVPVYRAMYLYTSKEFWWLMAGALSIRLELNDWISVSNVCLKRHLSPEK